MKKKFYSFLLCLSMIGTLILGTLPVQADTLTNPDDIVILYTNDVHTYVHKDGNSADFLSYDNIAAMKQDIAAADTANVLLVDAGDHIQGTAYGAMDNGQTMVELMKAAGYDLATLGNHEFDYGMTRALEIMNTAGNTPYVSCNFKDLRTGSNVLDSYKIFTLGTKKVAIIGVTTPETLTSSAPAYFQDGNGNFIYGIDGGTDGSNLYAAVQTAIDAAEAEGADYIIALGHLGMDPSSEPWRSADVIANTTGLDAFIDGHSHTTMAGDKVKDKNGTDVILTQTGSYFDAIGQLRIKADGTLTTTLVTEYTNSDAAVSAILTNWVSTVDGQLGTKIADSNIDFAIKNSEGQRLVRIMGTNLTDFNADSYYYYLNEVDGIGCDVAIINGGGVRADATGDWTYKTAKTINPFGNVLCLMEITGQQLLDALEWGAKDTTGKADSPENGGFLHAAGVTYKIDTTIPSTVQKDANSAWTGGPTGAYRVSDVKIYNRTTGTYDALDLNKKYTICGANYTLRNSGDGFNMFQGATLVKDYIAEDYMALSAYAKAFTDTDGNGLGNIASANSPLASYQNYPMNYEDTLGSGSKRIQFVYTAPEATTATTTETTTEAAPEATTEVATTEATEVATEATGTTTETNTTAGTTTGDTPKPGSPSTGDSFSPGVFAAIMIITMTAMTTMVTNKKTNK